MTEASVEALVCETAHRAGITASEVQWNDSGPGVTWSRGRTVVLWRTMLRTGGEVRFVAPHELGHVALGHQHSGPVFARAAVLMVASSFPLFASAVLAPQIGASWEIGLFLGVLLTTVLLVVAARWIVQPVEYAADAWAARRGELLTEDVARAAYGFPHPWTQGRGPYGAPTYLWPGESVARRGCLMTETYRRRTIRRARCGS